MPNVTISELPDAVLPLDGPNSFFEVQTVESGVDVSRKVASDNITVTVALPSGSVGQTIFNSDGAQGYTASSGVTVNPNGSVQMTFDALGAANIRLEMATDGVVLRDVATAVPNDLRLFFIEGVGFPVTLGTIGFNSSDIFTVDGLNQQVDINSNNASGVLISHIGVNVFQTFVGGFKAIGDAFELDNDGSDTLTKVEVRNLTGGVDLRVLVGGDVALSQLVGTTGAFEDDWLEFARNLGVTINHNNISMARSVAIGSGGFEVNNTVTGAGFERVLTTSDLGGGGSPFTEIIITNANVLDLVDTDVALNLGAADPDTAVHLELGLFSNGGGIQAKLTDTTVADLFINPLGETTWIGPPASAAVAGGFNLRAANGIGGGGNIIESTLSGIILEGRSGSNTILDFHQVNGNLAMRMVHNGTNFQFDNFIDSGETRFTGMDSLSATVQMMHMDPDAAVEIYHPVADTISIRTTLEGAEILGDTATGAQFALVSLDGTTPLARFRYQSGGLRIEPEVNNEGVSIFSRNAGGTLLQCFQAVNLGVAQIYNAGNIRMLSQTQGMTIRGNAATNAQFLIEGSGGVDMMTIQLSAVSTVFNSPQDSATFSFTGNDAGSVARNLLIMDPDGGPSINLHEVGVSVARTTTAGAGGLEANNTLTGAGFERVLTTGDLAAAFITDVMTGNTTMTNTTFITDVMTLALAANSRYAVDWCIEHASPAADDVKVRFNDPGGATWTGLGVWVIGASDDIREASPLGSQVDILSADGSVHSSFGSMIVGTDGNAGDLSFDCAKLANTGADGTMFQGSWMRAQLLT